MKQRTFYGHLIDVEERERPDTMQWCSTCQEHILRSADHDSSHIVREINEEDDEEEEEAEKVGAQYVVEIEKSVTWRFTEYAATDAQALEKARPKIDYGNATDAIDMHRDVREVEEVYEDDPEAEQHNLIP